MGHTMAPAERMESHINTKYKFRGPFFSKTRQEQLVRLPSIKTNFPLSQLFPLRRYAIYTLRP